MAFAIILLTGAALMIRTFASLRSVKSGLDPVNVLTLQTALSGSRYRTQRRWKPPSARRPNSIEGLPGVEFAAGALVIPMGGKPSIFPSLSTAVSPPRVNIEGDEQWRFVSAHYFEALHVPLLRGRTFDRRDTGKSDRVVIVNEALSRKYWPQADHSVSASLWVKDWEPISPKDRARSLALSATLPKLDSRTAWFLSCTFRRASDRRAH